MIAPETRERLTALMNARRLDLRMSWGQVADAAGLSDEAVRNLRNGRAGDKTGGVADLTARGIDAALRWEGGSVHRILAGGDPVPLEQMGTVTALPPPPMGRTGTDIAAAIAAGTYPGIEAILAAFDAERQAGGGIPLFRISAEQKAWQAFGPAEGRLFIGVLRWLDARTPGTEDRRRA